jgi:hypothetical protein
MIQKAAINGKPGWRYEARDTARDGTGDGTALERALK